MKASFAISFDLPEISTCHHSSVELKEADGMNIGSARVVSRGCGGKEERWASECSNVNWIEGDVQEGDVISTIILIFQNREILENILDTKKW